MVEDLYLTALLSNTRSPLHNLQFKLPPAARSKLTVQTYDPSSQPPVQPNPRNTAAYRRPTNNPTQPHHKPTPPIYLQSLDRAATPRRPWAYHYPLSPRDRREQWDRAGRLAGGRAFPSVVMVRPEMSEAILRVHHRQQRLECEGGSP